MGKRALWNVAWRGLHRAEVAVSSHLPCPSRGDLPDMFFTSTPGRTGTHCLAELVNLNAVNATAEHDPEPQGYGEPIERYDVGDDAYLEAHCECKLRRLTRGWLPMGERRSWISPSAPVREIYLESSHAFNKTIPVAMSRLKEYRVIHLHRSPLAVAKSFLNRGSVPGPRNRFLLRPGMERNILKPPGDASLTDFQLCLWYVYESEARHRQLEADLWWRPGDVYDIETRSLSDAEEVRALFDWMGVEYVEPLILVQPTNKNPLLTLVDPGEVEEAFDLVDMLAGL